MQTHEQARAAGEAGMQQVAATAIGRDPLFPAKAREAILGHLRQSPDRRAHSEDIVDAAIQAGVQPHTGKAFGPIFSALSREKLIKTVGFALRRKGHGTAGARVWQLNEQGA